MNLALQPLVSVVIPAYNEEENIAECVESVLTQTYQNWDCTIVNNCSKDKTLEIARRFAAKDPRIRVHDNVTFLGMQANHNLAMRQISPDSKYCKMVLSDDFIFPECLEKMVAVAEANPSVGIATAYLLHGTQVRSTGLPYQQTVLSGREACRHFLMQTMSLFGTQTSVLYRSDLVRGRDPFYAETNMCADFEACYALLNTTDLGFVHQVLTYSRPREGSIGAIAYDMGANYRSLLGMLFAYGKVYLSEEEFQKALDLQLSQYYRFLGRRLWIERSREFWSYHEKSFADVGLSLSRTRLVATAVGQLCGAVLNPKAMAQSIKRLSSLGKMRNSQTRQVVTPIASSPDFGKDTIADENRAIGRSRPA